MKNSIICLGQADYQQILQHINQQPTEEVCGLLGGVWQPYPRRAIVQSCIALPNAAATPQNRYAIAPPDLARCLFAFERAHQQLIGIYHSHPHGPARPSASDIAEATYSDAVYLIGVPQGELRAWRILRGQAGLHRQTWEVAIRIDETR